MESLTDHATDTIASVLLDENARDVDRLAAARFVIEQAARVAERRGREEQAAPWRALGFPG